MDTVNWLGFQARIGLRRLSLPLRAQILVSLACLALVGSEGIHAWRDRAERIREAQDTNANLALSLVQHAEDTIGIADAILVGLVERFEREGDSPAALADLEQQMTVQTAQAPRAGSFFIFGEDGGVLASSLAVKQPSLNYADRRYFQHHRASPSRDVHVGEMVRSRTRDAWVIIVSRRLQYADGSFAGVVIATIEADRFSKHYAGFDVGPRGTVALMGTDGTLLSRHPLNPAQIGQSFAQGELFRTLLPRGPSGSYHSVSGIDGIERAGGYHSSSRFPLLVVATSAVSDVLADWRANTLNRIVATGAFAGLLGWFGTRLVRQVRRRQDAERALQESELNFRLLTEASGDMVTRVAPSGLRSYVSPASTRLLGWTPAELLGTRALNATCPEDRQAAREALASVLTGAVENATHVYRALHRDGREIWVEASLQCVRDAATGYPAGAVVVSRDITERKILEQQLEVLATVDGLTGIANRRRLDQALMQEWRRAARDGTEVSLALMDVDRFKLFNDRYGHQAGDECLRGVAGALAGTAQRPADLVARYGGEEMAALLPGTDARGAGDVAEGIRAAVEALAVPHEGSAPAMVVTVSVGVATATPRANDDPAAGVRALLAAADQALYEAKRTGRNRVVAADAIPCAQGWVPAAGGVKLLQGA